MSGSSGSSITNTDTYSWIGIDSALWAAAVNWWDLTTGQAAASPPGALTAVTIATAPNAAAETITGGGSAASIGVTGNLSLTGTYTVGGAATVGTVTASASPVATAGSVNVSGGSIATAGLNVVDGTLILTGIAAISASGAVSVGLAGGIANSGTSALRLTQSTTVTIGGDLLINAGTVGNNGGLLQIGGAGILGGSIAPTGSSQAGIPSLLATNGGTTNVVGNVAMPSGVLVADGAGSRLTVGGTLTSGVGGTYISSGGGFQGAVLAVNGGAVQLGGLVLNPPGTTPVATAVAYVDAISSIEIGSAGSAAAGAITIDAGRTVTATASAGLYGNLINNGTLIVAGGTLLQSGTVSGKGVIDIARDATWYLYDPIASTNTISFLDTDAALWVGSSIDVSGTAYSIAANPLAALVTGFQPGDALVFPTSINGATYTAGTVGNPGTLTLSENGIIIANITLLGTYASGAFTLGSFSNNGGSATAVTLNAPAASSPAATNADTYVWIGPSWGSWETAGNWRDASTGANPASFVPGTLTPVVLASAAATPTMMSGGGIAASMSVTGGFDLIGKYAVSGMVSVGTLAVSPGTAATLSAGTLTVAGGGTLNAGAVTVVDGTLTLGTGAGLMAAGAMVLGLAAGTNVPNNGTYAVSSGAAGVASVGAGATVLAGGGLLVNAGSLIDADGVISVTGTLTVGTTANTGSGGASTSAAAGLVAVSGGGSLAVAGGIADLNGIVAVDGVGSVLSATGTLTALGSGTYGTLAASVAAANSGVIQLGGLALNAATGTSTSLVVQSGAVEIGFAGSAAAGAVTVDSGYTMTSGGSAGLAGNLINNGTVVIASGTLTQTGSVSGTGTVEIGPQAAWVLNGSIAAGETIAFLGTGATLALSGSAGAASFGLRGTLAGFQPGDSLIVPGPVTSVTYVAGTGTLPGTLTLRNGGSVVGTISLAGSYAKSYFQVTPVAGGSAIGVVNDLATFGVESLGSGATLSATAPGSWAINLGTVLVGGAALTDTIGVVNAGTGQVGTLSGTFSINGSGAFTNSGFASGFSGVAAGQEEHGQSIILSSATAGVLTETIVVSPVSTSALDSVALPNQTIVVTGTVRPWGTTYNLTSAPVTIVADANNHMFNVPSGALNSHDSLNGGGPGSGNVMNLIGGGGVFDLGAPQLLTNIQTLTATEGSSPTIIYMRNGYSMTVNLSPASGGGGSAIIYGGTGSDVFNLSTGSDTVVLGSASEVVHAGGGTALVQASAAYAGAVVTGSSTGSTVLEITNSGSVTLAAADAYLTVSLDASAHLSLGSAQFVTAVGSGGGDTIVAGATGQVLTGGGGADMLVGYTGFGDRFMDSSSGMQQDTITNFGGNDTINITDLVFGSLASPVITASVTTTTLGLSDGIHNTTVTLLGTYAAGHLRFGSDGHGGTAIMWQ